MTSAYPRTIFAVAALALFSATASAPAGQALIAPAAPPKLFKDARQMLAIARADRRSHITLLVAAKKGTSTTLAGVVREFGGDVRYRDDEIDYLRVRLPIERASRFSELDDIEAISTDVTSNDPTRLAPTAFRSESLLSRSGSMRRRLGSPGSAPADITGAVLPQSPQRETPNQWPPPGWGEYPLNNPYRPLADIDGVAMRENNPTFDGRGVTIALLDGNLDLLLPEFQTAYALDGTTVPKIADFVNTTDPRDDAEEMPQWVNMDQEVSARDRQISYGNKRFTAPHDGDFRIGLFSERRFNDPANAAYIDQDVDRNGNPRGDDGLFGVLWDERSNDVWVDTNRDSSFADETALTDYLDRPVIGVFGADDPQTAVRESIGFSVQTDADNKYVAINLGIYQHATGIMGSVIGNTDRGGRVEGVAPGARIASFFYGVGIAHGLIEGLIAACKHTRVDLVVVEQNVFIASIPYLLADGNHPLSVVTERLIERYDKLIFVPGGNSPGFAIVGEDGVASSAMSIGGYQSQDSYRVNLGFVPAEYDHMHWGGRAHGPSGSGGLKPDILAPSGQIGTEVGYVWRALIQENRGLFTLPPGYAIDGGTSTATPMAAGAAALVVSAAKQTGVPFDAARLKAALTGSARHLPNLPEFAQGNGLVQVEAAYELLRDLAEMPPLTIVGQAPVRTRLSRLMSTPHQGVGLYEREGWSVGDRGTRAFHLTRTSGPEGPMTFDVTWRGNDGTFRSPATIELPLDVSVDLPVDVRVESPGAHSAVITLDHPSVPGNAYRTLTTVVAPLRFRAEDDYQVRAEVSVPRPDDRSVFVEVPPGVAVLAVSMRSDTGAVRLAAVSPGREHSYPCGFGPAPAVPCAIFDPEPGVWELNASMDAELRDFEPRRAEPLEPGTVTVTASIAAARVAADPESIPLASGDTSADVAVSFTNRLAPVVASGVTTELGSASQATATIRQGEQHVYELEVPAGATSLSVRVGELTDADADLDIYLIDCTSRASESEPPTEQDRGNKTPPRAPPTCSPRAKQATVDAAGSARVDDPAAGRWVVVVDGFSVPAGATDYRYLDFYTHPALGSLSMADDAAHRQVGEQWTARAHAWAAGAPAVGRVLVARISAATRDFATTDGSPATLGFVDVPLRDTRPRPELGSRY